MTDGAEGDRQCSSTTGPATRAITVGPRANLSLVVLLRPSGTGTKLHAFDRVVTVARGSTVAATLLSKSVWPAEGVRAFARLVFLQCVVPWLSARSPRVGRLVKSEPTRPRHRGAFLGRALKAQGVTREEALAALRSQDIHESAKVDALVPVTGGSLRVQDREGRCGWRRNGAQRQRRWAPVISEAARRACIQPAGPGKAMLRSNDRSVVFGMFRTAGSPWRRDVHRSGRDHRAAAQRS